jgi:hypothetical protein
MTRLGSLAKAKPVSFFIIESFSFSRSFLHPKILLRQFVNFELDSKRNKNVAKNLIMVKKQINDEKHNLCDVNDEFLQD